MMKVQLLGVKSSGVGRMRNEKAIPFLLEMLNYDDPKIISKQ